MSELFALLRSFGTGLVSVIQLFLETVVTAIQAIPGIILSIAKAILYLMLGAGLLALIAAGIFRVLDQTVLEDIDISPINTLIKASVAEEYNEIRNRVSDSIPQSTSSNSQSSQPEQEVVEDLSGLESLLDNLE